MSRTLRRNKKHLIRDACPTLDEVRSGNFWTRRCYRNLTPEQIYERLRARHLADNNKDTYSPPRWWLRMFYTRPQR